MPLILIAGQNQTTRQTLCEPLESNHYSVITVNNDQDCAAVVHARKPDGVILDDHWPDAANVCAALRADYPQLPILMLISEANAATLALEAGASDVIEVPIQPTVLGHRLARLLESSRYMQPAARDTWYQSIIENAIEGIFRSTPDGRFLMVNPALVKLAGYDSPEEVLSLNLRTDLHVKPEQRDQVVAVLNQSPEADFEVIWKRKDQRLITVRVHGRVIRDSQGGVLYYEGQALDITEQKSAQAALIRSQLELQAKTESLETISLIADAVYESLELETVLERALKAVINYLDVPGASLYLVDETGNFLQRIATRGVAARLSAAAAVLPLENSLNGQAVATRDIVISDNPPEDIRIQPVVREALADTNIRQIIVVPLLFRDQVTGTLSLPLQNQRSLTPQERATLISVGKTIGLALANAQYVWRLETEGQERLRAELAENEQRVLAEALRDTAAVLSSALDQDDVLGRILTSVGRLFLSDMANIYLIDDDGIAYNVHSTGYGEQTYALEAEALRINVNHTPNLQWIARTGLPRVIDDTLNTPDWVVLPGTAWIRSSISAPIQIDGRVIGFLNLDSAQPNTFRARDAETLKIFADQAGVAIRNARLYDDVRKHADVLEQRVEERTSELAIERAKLKVLLDSMADGVFGIMYDESLTLENFWTLQHSYRYINQALYQMLGYADSEWDDTIMLGKHMTRDESQTIQRTFMESVIQNGSWDADLHIWRKDGSDFDASLRSTAVRGSDGGVIGSITIFRDISQEKQLERQRERFISNAAHELRTPITNLKTRLYLARKQPERMATHLQILEQVTDNMKELVEYLLDLSRIERGTLQLRRENFYLEHFLAEMVNIQKPEAEKNGLRLNLELPPYPLVVNADPGRINQVITNLLSNAIRHTPSGGQITVRAERGGGDRADWALIQVNDTGRGIKPEHLALIFEPFYQVNQGATGVGLGLSISKEIIEMHGGHISVESVVDEGTCFSIRLQLVE